MHSIAARARELVAERRRFVQATVVRAQCPTSARPGDAAIVLPDGTIEGFVGGNCAESTVRAQALALLDRGDSLLLRMRKQRYPRLRRRAPGTPRRLARLVRRCLRAKPGGRPSTTRSVRMHLETMIGAPSPTDARVDAAALSSPERR